MIKVGFEVEAFLLDGASGVPMLVSDTGLPYDECGWLVEVRSEPHTDVTKALFLLRAELYQVDQKVKELGDKLSFVPYMRIPRGLKVEAARRNTKGLLRYQNIYGHQTHKVGTNYGTASTHISFTNEQEFRYIRAGRDGGVAETKRYPGFVDHAKLIMGLDKAFKEEIRKARRNPGFYEVKDNGRIEYRSLPNNVSMKKLNDVLKELLTQ